MVVVGFTLSRFNLAKTYSSDATMIIRLGFDRFNKSAIVANRIVLGYIVEDAPQIERKKGIHRSKDAWAKTGRIDWSPWSSPLRPRWPSSWTVARYQRCGSARPICSPRDLSAGRTPSPRRTRTGRVFERRYSRFRTLLLAPLWIKRNVYLEEY